MAEQNCAVCGGDGLVGAGDQPTLKQGPLSTCTYCLGTGKINVTDETKPSTGTDTGTEPKKNEESSPE
jgi:DnaJ-class molecular chaperone